MIAEGATPAVGLFRTAAARILARAPWYVRLAARVPLLRGYVLTEYIGDRLPGEFVAIARELGAAGDQEAPRAEALADYVGPAGAGDPRAFVVVLDDADQA